MANTTITDLPNATTPLGPEYIVLDQGGETKRLQLSDLFLNSGSETITSLTQNGNVLSYTNEAGVVNTIDTETVTSLSLSNGVLSYTDEANAVTTLNVIQDETVTSLSSLNGVLTYTDEAGADTVLNIIGDNTVTASKLTLSAPPTDGDFLIYDAATDGFQVTASTAQAHDLFSANHTDVASNVTPSYGDSMYYNGTEWTTGNFGNYGADMEYVNLTAGTLALYISGDETTTTSTRTTGTSYILDTSADFVYNVADFVGDGLQNSNIRGIYLELYTVSFDGGSSRFSGTFPDGSQKNLSSFFPLSAHSYSSNEQVFIPINEGQESFTLKHEHQCFDGSPKFEWSWRILGAECTRRVALSPEVDVIHIVGSQDSAQVDQGYVDVDTNSFNTDTSVWSSENPTSLPAADWSGVFPITIPDNVSKTVIRLVNNWNYFV